MIMKTGSWATQPSAVETDQTNALANGLGKVVDDIDGGIEPFGQFVIEATRLFLLRDLLSECSEDGAGRIAGFKFGK